MIATVVMAREHSISFLCGDNIAVSYSSGVSSSGCVFVVLLRVTAVNSYLCNLLHEVARTQS